MSVTAKLVKVFQVDNQLRALQLRLKAAERVLGEQGKFVTELDTKRKTLETQLKTLQAQAGNAEGEMKALDEKIASIKEKMNSAQTQKEYKAFLTEVNTYKIDRDKTETLALELMGKVDIFKKQLEEIETKSSERGKMATVAKTDRDQRELEIKDKVETLKAQRVLLAAEVPADILKDYERVFEQRGEDAVAFIEMQSRKDMDFTCGGCMMHIPADTINGLLATGRITRCSSCRCYLYVTDELTKTLSEPMKGRKKADAL